MFLLQKFNNCKSDILLIAIITICVVSPTYPNQQGRVCVGCCWAFIAVLCVACAILSVLGFILDALAGINCDNDVFKVVPDLKSECEDITTIGKYLSIASAGVFFVTFLLSICLCCFGCFCQSCDEPGREDTVTFVRGGRIV
ncbi:uncharacterized protein LOC134191395 isoform X2 [Corticium candelabrum]|uniref:uncharacterized protein LOC134191395 isoform X2 n=1 Tax=Corticium candelabrum TaxID=121492 RepID=UPI002E26DAB2|nr:uncharacterized protein LOC134191395 isoform X2 [Corticium candelabrum]